MTSRTKSSRRRRYPHPGKPLREQVLPLFDLTPSETAALLGVSRQTLHGILAERRPVTLPMALRLSKLFGLKVSFWHHEQERFDLFAVERDIKDELRKIPTLKVPRSKKVDLSRYRWSGPVHPGEPLRKDFLPAFGLTTSETADLLRVSRHTLYGILAEKRPVTLPMALRFGKLFANSRYVWIVLQFLWDLREAECELKAELRKISTLKSTRPKDFDAFLRAHAMV